WKVTLSPLPRVIPLRSTSPEPTGGPPPASGSRGSPEKTASRARSDPGARPAGSEISGSDAAKTCAKPHYEGYLTRSSSSTQTAPDRASSGCSDSSSTATTDAKAAISELENPPSKPSEPRY